MTLDSTVASADPTSSSTARPMTPVAPLTPDHSALSPLGIDVVRITGGDWADWQRDNREVTIPHVLDWLERDGTIDNLRRLDPASAGQPQRRGLWFTDSDLYKHLEGIAWEHGRAPSRELAAVLDDLAAVIARAQEPDGYLNSFVQAGLDVRWDNLVKSHEHYCIGHLGQAAVAEMRSSGSTGLLDPTLRAVDRILADFGGGRRNLVDGHEEIEMALVELYRETGRGELLELAQQFIDDRGHGVLRSDEFEGGYFQDAVRVRDQTEVVGHAVRAIYLIAGIADVYLETGEQALLDAAIRQWETMTARKSYLTGAFGSRFEGEAFGDDHELPPDLAYGETCATIGNVMASWRLLLATGESRFADAIERGLYNLFAASTSVERDAFFYNNPAQRRSKLPASPKDTRPARAAAPGTRPVWFECACCPPNIVRTIASLGAYVSTADAVGVQVHQYLPARINAEVAELEMSTDYPLDGRIRLLVARGGGEWELSLRIPDWATTDGDAGTRATLVTADGSTRLDARPDERGYLRVSRVWSAGDVVELELSMEPRLTVAHPAVDALRGTVAVERGPLVYALESPDQGDGVDVNSVELAVDRPLVTEREELLGREVVTIRATGVQADTAAWGDSGYAVFGLEPPSPGRQVALKLIPYALWANRGPSIMRIHLPWRRLDSAESTA